MKKLYLTAIATLLLTSTTIAMACDAHHTQHKKTAHQSVAATKPMSNKTVAKKSVNYTCLNRKTITVTYGFNQAGLPTYAQAILNGKTRTMPINLARTDNVDTVFGAENRYSLMADPITRNHYKSSINIQSPNNEILFKGCNAR